MERPCIGAASLVSVLRLQLPFYLERTYETKVVDILSWQVLNMLQAEAPFRLCHGVSLGWHILSGENSRLTDNGDDGKASCAELCLSICCP